MSKLVASRETLRDGFFRVVVAAVIVAVAVLVASAVGAARIAPVEAAAPPIPIADSALKFTIPGGGANIAAAVANDIFTDDRQAPLRRYRLPGEADNTPGQPAPRPVVLGTVLASDGAHFATCQVSGGQPTIVRVGAKLGGFTVVSIERGRVTFRSAEGERFSIDASKPVP
ncbi:MAG: hypothetical protein O2973_07580 [Gemmatimonadetes bacterium]|nr:hypothetical protein [Gemmatimonadota bacterium]